MEVNRKRPRTKLPIAIVDLQYASVFLMRIIRSCRRAPILVREILTLTTDEYLWDASKDIFAAGIARSSMTQ